MQHISAMQAVDYSDNRDISDVLVEIWSFMADTITKCKGKYLDVLSDFVVILFDSIHLDNLQGDNLNSV